AIEVGVDPRAGDMLRQQQWNAESEHVLRYLAPGDAQRATLPKRVERQRHMQHKRAIEQNGNGRIGPQRVDHRQHRFHSGDGDDAEAVIDEMRHDIGEEDQARHQPQTPNHGLSFDAPHGAASPSVESIPDWITTAALLFPKNFLVSPRIIGTRGESPPRPTVTVAKEGDDDARWT